MRYSTNKSYKETMVIEVNKVIKKIEDDEKTNNKVISKISNIFSKIFKKN
jgi:hypothetical protein